MRELISVVARRRRWTLDQKLALVEEVLRPGTSVAAVADRHAMRRGRLFAWRDQVREGTMPGVVRAKAAARLVPVRVVAAASPREVSRLSPPSRGPAGRPGESVATIEVVRRNGRVLRFCVPIGPGVLGRLAAALEG